MIALSTAQDPPVLFVEWFDRPSQEESRRAALAADTVVLTWSALHTLFSLNLTAQVESRYDLLAPRSLHDEMRRELSEAEQRVNEGYSFLASGGPVFTVQEYGPGDETLVSQRDHLRRQLQWLENAVKFEPRPLERIGPTGSEEEESRNHLGHSSFDAVALAQHHRATLYTDDLGLRRHAAPAPSFSTIALLPALVVPGILTADERDDSLLKLIGAHYLLITPDDELLRFAILKAPELPRPAIVAVFDLLGSPAMTLTEASEMAARAIKFAAIQTIERLSCERVAELCLDAMARQWLRISCADALEKAAREELVLLPVPLGRVRQVFSASRGRR
jgi:hypothetical protein